MLDVYRKFYRFTGEPFRLGPDHRFSLHHSSYANAKAYLEYAIFQGEGFVAITGGPGTGKTTLISEILSVVDKDKIEVSTLTSTQLESRDLLHMVAHSFGIDTGDTSKSNLLLEIESFLVKRIRSGQRAILIVDEAQGLSGGALEELRLLANLQFEYQLLLQIVLVGQEQLLELIKQPAMEHLRQRMVAATSLEPLDLDETIDYIEHRLSRVAWEGDPGLEEGALSLVYRYSGGVPRRINLIMNRLFLYGGMEEKHQYLANDVEDVIKGLIEEFLLPPDPLIAEADLEKRHTASDVGKRPRYLPRKPAEKPVPQKPAEAAASDPAPKNAVDKPEPVQQKKGEKSHTISPRTTDSRRVPASDPAADMDIGSARRNQGKHPAPEGKAGGPTAPVQQSENADQRTIQNHKLEDVPAEDVLNRKKGGKGLFIAILLLATAGSAYLLRDESASLDKMFSVVTELKEQQLSSNPEVDPEREPAQQSRFDDLPASEKGRIDRNESVEMQGPQSVGTVVLAESSILNAGEAATEEAATEEAAAKEAAAKEAAAKEAAAREAAAKEAAAKEAAAREAAAKEAAAREAAAREAAAKEAVAREAAAREAAAKEAAARESAVNVAADISTQKMQRTEKPRSTEEPPIAAPPTAEAGKVLTENMLETRRVQLRQEAEQRFNVRQTNALAKAEIVSRQAPLSTVAKTAAPKKKPRITADKVKRTLLQGRWSSAGKPASLLPSESTSCREQPAGLICNSVPQNVKTQYGLALYKVETQLSEFSPEGHFELAYRTLVRLVDGASLKQSASDDGGWQITEYSMSCTLADNNRVSCLDGKGVTREYRRSLR
jgi:type II secretory pathway predicted ATPase ExeA